MKGSTFVPVILKYNQSLESFYDATYRGRVSLQSKKGMNYYFTPLGKSYVCVEDEDPITLFNTDDEPGNLTIALSFTLEEAIQMLKKSLLFEAQLWKGRGMS